MTDQERATAIKNLLGGFTLEELHAAFDVVQNRENWKRPIRATIPKDRVEITRAAVIHFTGSVPIVTPCPDGVHVEIEAAGYYIAVGA